MADNECDGSQYALAASILISVVASLGAILKICASKGMYCESNCSGNPCICDTNEGRPERRDLEVKKNEV
jgi:hypothetical protein